MKIIAGLGNPGRKYQKTRHNAGFMAVELLADKYGLKLKKEGFRGIYSIGRIKNEEIVLFEPMTYMNLSGEAVKSVFSSKAEDIGDLLVISDDFNLPLGTIRIRTKGSSGGHNGLDSIIQHMGDGFSRLRVGIAPERELYDASSFVLERFSGEEMELLEGSLEKTVECVELWIEKGTREAMNRYN